MRLRGIAAHDPVPGKKLETGVTTTTLVHHLLLWYCYCYWVTTTTLVYHLLQTK